MLRSMAYSEEIQALEKLTIDELMSGMLDLMTGLQIKQSRAGSQEWNRYD